MSAGYDPTASSLELKQLFEERLRRPWVPRPLPASAPAPSNTAKNASSGSSWTPNSSSTGATEPTARVTLQGEPVKLRPDGTFTMALQLAR